MEITLAAIVWNIGHAFLVVEPPIHTAESTLMMFAALFQKMQSLLEFYLLPLTQDVVRKGKIQAVMAKLIWQNGPGM
jgi:hypothetical protein